MALAGSMTMLLSHIVVLSVPYPPPHIHDYTQLTVRTVTVAGMQGFMSMLTNVIEGGRNHVNDPSLYAIFK
jgi:hypothetical protein